MRPFIIPKHEDSNGWWETLDPAPPPLVLSEDVRVETVVVGAGVCGLAVAHQLGKLFPEVEIALVEAERAGYGASGRNAGFMLNLHSHGPPKRLEILRRNMRLWESGLRDLRRMAEEFQIECGWSDFGRIYGSAGRDGETHIDEIADTLEQLDLAHTWLTQDDMEGRLGTRFYRRGLQAEGSALVNPAALMRGLARNLPINVTLYEETPVLEYARESEGYVITTSGGTIHADRLVIAAGVFLDQFGIAKRRYLPMATYASLTAPLSKAAIAGLGSGEPFGLLASSEYGSTIRLTSDRRLFVRNLFRYKPSAPTPEKKVLKISMLHAEAMRKRWPHLTSTEIEHSWGGTMAFTRNDGAVFGEFGPNLFAVLTNDVSPMTRGAAAGRLLDELVGSDAPCS